MISLYVLFILLSYVFNVIKLIKSYNDRVLNVGLIREKWFEYKSRGKWALVLDLALVPLVIWFFVEISRSNKDTHQDTDTVWGWFQSLENPTSIYSIQFVIMVIMIVVTLFFEIRESNTSTIISREGILAADGELIPWNRVEEIEEGHASESSLNRVAKITVKTKREKTKTLKLIVPKDEFRSLLIATRNAINLNREE
ncbi:hypothetical protein JHL18_18675 [Clostridium sp. YIM B02505]|uniref:DUF5673 domain-containing protein n=1 Tax=Clostridium yunnanense TaxID=2800325 RepID=A0ABS1ETF2_9CLOT|nr:hypothetical protein [Clostridium yunnanense]MBK1812648.1 hypothetical protein [Clostridium yunnanense]